MTALIPISNIQIHPVVPNKGLVAFATCEINDSFFLGNIAVYTAPNRPLGYRLVFPTKSLSSGKQIPCFYPYKREIEEAVTNAIIKKYIELMDNFINH
jgi:hypothetical protein